MKSLEQIREVIGLVQCDPFRFRLDCIDCVRAGVSLNRENVTPLEHEHQLYLQATLFRKDTSNGDFAWGAGGKYFISPHMTDGEIVKKCFVAARDYAEHEVREAFLYNGRRVLGPHVHIQTLWEIANETEVRHPQI